MTVHILSGWYDRRYFSTVYRLQLLACCPLPQARHACYAMCRVGLEPTTCRL
nr:MAG TPA: hypothetical protein [Bacteriophage sp.]